MTGYITPSELMMFGYFQLGAAAASAEKTARDTNDEDRAIAARYLRRMQEQIKADVASMYPQKADE